MKASSTILKHPKSTAEGSRLKHNGVHKGRLIVALTKMKVSTDQYYLRKGQRIQERESLERKRDMVAEQNNPAVQNKQG